MGREREIGGGREGWREGEREGGRERGRGKVSKRREREGGRRRREGERGIGRIVQGKQETPQKKAARATRSEGERRQTDKGGLRVL